ncbi:MAG: hypothetical protein HKN82_07320 [Akkermansiaceae bacterium]|nr:hypothetical protein [Akkermansiaceae bacterium]NNM29893.1 hypothetical protein [Akkermansiaceae bacterium]
MSLKTSAPARKWVDTSAEVAPAVLGVAAGIFLGDLMHRGARRPVALALAAVGIAAVAPTLLEAVKDRVAGPNTRRGSQRTLRTIREASGAPTREIDYVEEELGEMYVG